MTGHSALILANNYLRYPFPLLPRAGWHKEWYHFCLASEDLDLLVNLNVSGDSRPAAAPGSRVARIVLLARTEQGWSGDVEIVDPRVVELTPGGVGLKLGQNYIRFGGGDFEVVAALQSSPLVVDLRLQPVATPLGATTEVPVGSGFIGWFVVPRLLAEGRVVAGDRAYSLRAADAYHDHNWGRWLWGEDFSWEWGFAHVAGRGEVWTLVFDRTFNRKRTRLLEATLGLWRGGELVKLFSRREITARPLTFTHPEPIVRIPPALALTVPELGREVPRLLEVTATSGSDRLSLRLTTIHEAQVLIPNETDLETTIITEVVGRVDVEGTVGGRRLAGTGRGVFEFLA